MSHERFSQLSANPPRCRTSCRQRLVLASTTAAITVLAGAGALATRAGDLVFRTHVLNAESEFVAAAAIDVNHDGRLDVVCGAFWYEAPSWTRRNVRDVEIFNGRPDGYAHIPLDVNRDGWMDVLSVNYRSASLRWTEHPGPSLGEWPIHTIAEPGPMETGRLYDIDGDGRLDVLPNGAGFAAWWSLAPESGDETAQPIWRRHDLPQQIAGHGVGAGDVDGDGRTDVVGQFGWASAPERPNVEPWEFQSEFQLDRASVPILVVDVDDDGDNDLVWCRGHDFGVYWSEQRAGQRGVARWLHHVIDTSWSGGHSPLWVDMDGDGKNELVVGKRFLAHEGRDPGEYDPQYGYRYQFDETTRTWRRWPLSIGEGVGYGLDPKAVDLDADGDLDLLCGGRNGLYWLENEGPPTAAQSAVVRDRLGAPLYDDDSDFSVVKEMTGEVRALETPFDWGRRRAHIMAEMEARIGLLPTPEVRVPLNVETTVGDSNEAYDRRAVQFNVAPERRAVAHLFVPRGLRQQAPAVLIAPEPGSSQNESTGANGSLERLGLAEELARRGFVCLVPDFRWMKENLNDNAEGEASSSLPKPSMQAIWNNIRAIDLLDSLDEVTPLRIGIVGSGHGGAAALLTATFDQRINAVAVELAPTDLTAFEVSAVLAAVAPRPMLVRTLANSPPEDIDGLRSALDRAREVYEFRNANSALASVKESTADVGKNIDSVAAWLAESLRPPRRPPRR